jgi:HEAT repeat protein
LGETRSEVAVTELLKKLDNVDSHIRWLTIQELGKIGSQKAIPRLLETLKNDEYSNRGWAVHALGKIGCSEEAIPELVNALQDSNSSTREWSAQVLGEIGSEQAIPSLLNALQDPKLQKTDHLTDVHADVIRALGKIVSTPKHLNLIKAYLKGGTWETYALKMGFVQTISALLQARINISIKVRKATYWALDQIRYGLTEWFEVLEDSKSKQPIEAYRVGYLRSESSSEAEWFEILEIFSTKGYHQLQLEQNGGRVQILVAKLLIALESTIPGVQVFAFSALSQINPALVIPQLLQALEAPDSDKTIRRCASFFLTQIDSESVVAGLFKILIGKNSEGKLYAAHTLSRIGSDSVVAGLLETLTEENPSTRHSAAHALSEMASESIVIRLFELFTGENSEARFGAYRVLVKIGSEPVIKGLLKILRTGSDGASFWAALALEDIASEQAVIGLLESLQDANPDVRFRSVYALDEIGFKEATPEAVPNLIEMLETDLPIIRSKAASALGQLAIVSDEIASELIATSLLKAQSDDPDPKVRRNASQALKRVRSGRRTLNRHQ